VQCLKILHAESGVRVGGQREAGVPLAGQPKYNVFLLALSFSVSFSLSLSLPLPLFKVGLISSDTDTHTHSLTVENQYVLYTAAQCSPSHSTMFTSLCSLSVQRPQKVFQNALLNVHSYIILNVHISLYYLIKYKIS